MTLIPRLVFVLLWLLSASPAHALKEDREVPLNISARHVEVNEKTGAALYRGNVVLVQGSLRIEAERLEIRSHQNKPDLVLGSGNPLVVRQRQDRRDEEVEIRAARLEYRVRERRLDLYDQVSLRQGQDAVTAQSAHYDINEKRFQARGGDAAARVAAVFHPRKKVAP
jgi:lipopolysaccharide export system protein LptA